MSGPKVVRIVTREELVGLCEGLLARHAEAEAIWTEACERAGVLTEDDIAFGIARRSALERMLAEDRFVDLQKAVPAEIAYLESDAKERFARVVDSKARARTSARQTAAVAAAVLATLDRDGIAVDTELRGELHKAAAGRIDCATSLQRAFELMESNRTPERSGELARLAAALKEGDDRLSVREWLAGQALSRDEERLARLDRRLAELGVTLGDEAAAAFDERLRRASAETSADRQSLLVDSLEIDLAGAVARAQRETELRARLRMLASELSGTGSAECEEAARALVRLDANAGDIEKLEAQGTAVLERHRSVAAAGSRRRALLEGLAAVGYQVNEGMQTAWAKDGRVVVKAASQPGYGVELAGGTDASRVQLRTVAFRSATTVADVSQDRDAETIWCGKLATLRERLAADGVDVVIEQARPAGAVPVRVVAEVVDPGEVDARRVVPPNLKQRRLD